MDAMTLTELGNLFDRMAQLLHHAAIQQEREADAADTRTTINEAVRTAERLIVGSGLTPEAAAEVAGDRHSIAPAVVLHHFQKEEKANITDRLKTAQRKAAAGMPIRAAAEEYKLPKSTLGDACKGKMPKYFRAGRQ